MIAMKDVGSSKARSGLLTLVLVLCEKTSLKARRMSISTWNITVSDRAPGKQW